MARTRLTHGLTLPTRFTSGRSFTHAADRRVTTAAGQDHQLQSSAAAADQIWQRRIVESQCSSSCSQDCSFWRRRQHAEIAKARREPTGRGAIRTAISSAYRVVSCVVVVATDIVRLYEFRKYHNFSVLDIAAAADWQCGQGRTTVEPRGGPSCRTQETTR